MTESRSTRVLLAEDDAQLGDALYVGLKQHGFDPLWVRDGGSAETALLGEHFAAIVLDLGLPNVDGMTLLRRERARGSKVPVLILTARDALQDRVGGLDGGADDYLVKPVDLQEVAARLRALIRRSGGEAAALLRVGELALDAAARRVTFRGELVDLQAKEFALLQELMLNAGRVLTREQIEERIYRWGDEIGSNTIEVHIHHLRRKLAPDVIHTIRGIGYVMPQGTGFSP
ncbi:MAG: winged helix-turn-helix domain-containing protein [Betaproteobacteria bacterium]|nr:winged helix-turn-helix domain-containing protein [Betaproteobacteria bacterium]